MTPQQWEWVNVVTMSGATLLTHQPLGYMEPCAHLVTLSWTRIGRTTDHVLLPDGSTL